MSSLSAKWVSTALYFHGFLILWLTPLSRGMAVVEGSLLLCIRPTGLWIEPGSMAH